MHFSLNKLDFHVKLVEVTQKIRKVKNLEGCISVPVDLTHQSTGIFQIKMYVLEY